MSIMCGEIIFHHTPRFFLLLENVVILNFNKCSKLTLTQKIEEPLSTRLSMCLEASIHLSMYYFKNPTFYHTLNISRFPLFFFFFFKISSIFWEKKKTPTIKLLL